MKKSSLTGKASPTVIFLLLLTVVCLPAKTLAQIMDTLDVAPGYQTLNQMVSGDTTTTGAPNDTNRVYRLQRGGAYLLNGSIQNVKGSTLRIVAAEGAGAMPILIPAASTSGSSSRPFSFSGNALLKGLYISGINNIGNPGDKNMLRMNATGMTLTVDSCFLDYEAQSFVRMNAPGQSVYFINSQLRNTMLPADPANGRFIDTRGNVEDTIYFQNSTLYVGSDAVIRDGGSPILNVMIDHCTFYQCAGSNFAAGVDNSHNTGVFDVSRCVDLTFTNNLLINVGFEGDWHPNSAAALTDTTEAPIICIDSLNAPSIASESQRHYTITNNVWGYTSDLLNYYASTDSMKPFVFLNKYDSLMISGNPNFVVKDNLEDTVAFTNAPKDDSLLAYTKYREQTAFAGTNNPDIFADENGVGQFSSDQGSFGTGPNPFTFSYNTNCQAYTYATHGFPVGDLNWFPDKYGQWLPVVERGGPKIPAGFSLSQNYPNPFNPTTQIVYSVPRNGFVTLNIYNVLGQKIATLFSGTRTAGDYVATFNGDRFASGVYFYRLETGGVSITMKMLLLK